MRNSGNARRLIVGGPRHARKKHIRKRENLLRSFPVTYMSGAEVFANIVTQELLKFWSL